MKKSKVSKDQKLVDRKKAIDFASSMRGQMLIGKALHYGMIKIIEVEKEKQHFQSWVKELEDLRIQSEIDEKEIFKSRDIKQQKKDKKRIKELEKLTQNYKTSDVEDLEYIAENLYSPWIEMCKFTEQFDDGDLSELIKKQE